MILNKDKHVPSSACFIRFTSKSTKLWVPKWIKMEATTIFWPVVPMRPCPWLPLSEIQWVPTQVFTIPTPKNSAGQSLPVVEKRPISVVWPSNKTYYMDVSENSGTPKSSILIGCSIINYPFWGTPIFGNTHIYIYNYIYNFSEFFRAPCWGRIPEILNQQLGHTCD